MTDFYPEYFSWTSIRFAQSLVRIYGKEKEGISRELFLLMVLLYRASEEGHFCLDFNRIRQIKEQFVAEIQLKNQEVEPSLILLFESLEEKQTQLLIPPFFVNSDIPGESDEFLPAPFIWNINSHYLYLRKNHDDEQLLACLILKKSMGTGFFSKSDAVSILVDLNWSHHKMIENRLSLLEKALQKSFFLLTGGPGTGKTTFTAFYLAAFRKIFYQKYKRFPHICLAAPTGRAAYRMKQSIEHVGKSYLPELLDVTWETSTIHKLMGINSVQPQGKYNSLHQLPADLLVVDESSMVDMSLMLTIMKSLPEHTGLVLIGDKDQLPAVEAGSFLHDLLEGTESIDHPLHSHLFSLKTSHRSLAEITRFATVFLNRDDEEQNFSEHIFLDKPNSSDPVQLLRINEITLSSLFEESFGFLRNLRPFRISGILWKEQIPEIERIWNKFQSVCVLSPQRSGEFGINRINSLLSRIIHNPVRMGLFHGQIIMVTRNSYEYDLFNGDKGLVLQFQGDFLVFFENPESPEGFRMIRASQLPPWETAFAITIHKSQGSEYSRVILLLPDESELLATREIVYTGLTRARDRVYFLTSVEAIKKASSRSLRRHSGLSLLLKGDTADGRESRTF